MNDIRPVKPPQKVNPIQTPPPPPPEVEQQPPVLQEPPKKRRSIGKLLLIVFGIVIGIVGIGGIIVYMWYQNALQPVSPDDSSRMRVTIVEGSSPAEIGRLLEEKKLIKSTVAFDIYTRLSNTRSSLQAGSYRLSPSESVPELVDHMVAGRVDQFSLTFYPGATLTDPTDTPKEKKTDVTSVLLRAGYTEEEIASALAKKYDHPLFATKPASADLEGYVYGETYNFDSSATVEQILERTFDEFHAVIQENNLVEAFQKHNLTLYQGITLASIIQREEPGAETQKQVAQVFFKRLSIDMELGSDPTYQYAARKMGVAPTPSLDSPYNTRKVKGLPPGPIAAPGVTALQAVANPAPGDYLFFLSGDDDKTYFSYTFEEHEANIRDHCQIKCSSY